MEWLSSHDSLIAARKVVGPMQLALQVLQTELSLHTRSFLKLQGTVMHSGGRLLSVCCGVLAQVHQSRSSKLWSPLWLKCDLK